MMNDDSAPKATNVENVANVEKVMNVENVYRVLCPRCFHCGKQALVEMTAEEVKAMNSGKLIQDALPHWTKDQRELLISGTHPECWDGVGMPCFVQMVSENG